MLDEVAWWRIDDLWMWAVDALVIYVRVAADRTAAEVGQICERLAQRRGIDLGTPNSAQNDARARTEYRADPHQSRRSVLIDVALST